MNLDRVLEQLDNDSITEVPDIKPAALADARREELLFGMGMERFKVANLVLFAFALICATACASSGSATSNESALEPAEAPTTLPTDVPGVAAEPDEFVTNPVPTSEEEPTPTPDPTATPEPTPTPAPPIVFTSASAEGLVDVGATSRVHHAIAPTADRPQWVIVGQVHEGDRSTPTAWVSETADIGTTRAVELEDVETGSASRVVAVDGVVVVTGSITAEGEGTPAVWRLEDGQWQLIEAVGITSDIKTFGNLFAVDGKLVATVKRELPVGDLGEAILVSDDHGSSWSRAEFDDLDRPHWIRMNGVAETDDRWIGVGDYLEVEGQTSVGVIWASDDDGMTWSLVDEIGPEQDSGGVVLTSIVNFRDQLVAAGSTSTGNVHTPAIWTSTDGEEWLLEKATFGATDDRYVSFGKGASNLTTDGNRLIAHSSSVWTADVWTSTDVLTWDVLPGIRDIEQGQGVGIAELGFNLDGTIVAVESSNRPIEHRNGAWTRKGTEAAFPQATEVPDVREVAWHEGRFVVVGSVNDHSTSYDLPRIWWSDDGEKWFQSYIYDPSSSRLSNVAATVDGFVAVGKAGYEDYGYNPLERFWHSPYGKSWEQTDTLGRNEGGSVRIADFTAFSDEIIVVGTEWGDGAQAIARPIAGFGSGSGSDVSAAAVTNSLEDQGSNAACASSTRAVAFMYQTEPRFTIHAVAYDAATREAHQATADDGSFTSAGSQQVSDCVWTGDEFVAVGTATDGQGTNAQIWRSPDGESWSLAEMPPSMLADADQAALDVAAFDGGLIVLGIDQRHHAGSVMWVYHNDRWWFVENPISVSAAKSVTVQDVAVGDRQIVAVGNFGRVEHIWTASLDEFLESLATAG